jgi:hypothetical protein
MIVVNLLDLYTYMLAGCLRCSYFSLVLSVFESTVHA